MAFSDAEDRGSSDPLPYTQVDRAVKPKATQLASLIGTSPQHALGSLVEFWDLNGDPRDLEKLVAAGENEVVLDRETLITRFEIASGKTVDPAKLVVLGLLEPCDGGRFRVRGMSRYFAPITSRLMARERARKAGVASAEARRLKTGSAQPRKPSADGSTPSSADVPSGVPNEFEPSSGEVRDEFNDRRTSGNLADSGQRTAVSVQQREEPPPRSIEPTPPPPPPAPIAVVITPPDTPREAWLGYDFWRWAQSVRVEGGYVAEKPPRDLDTWWSRVMMTLNGDVDRACAAFEEFGQDAHWEAERFPFRAFMSQWEGFVPRRED